MPYTVKQAADMAGVIQMYNLKCTMCIACTLV